MQRFFMDQNPRGESGLHRMRAGVKLAVALGLVVGIALWPRQGWDGVGLVGAWILGVGLGLLVWRSGMSWRFLMLRLLLLEPFVVGIMIVALLNPVPGKAGGEAWGSAQAGVLLVRCTFCLTIMILLAYTTSFNALLGILRRWQVPMLLVTTLMLMYRYMFVLIDEMQRMNRARQCRTFKQGWLGRWKIGASVLSHLLVRATERAERIYAAMCARGWNGQGGDN